MFAAWEADACGTIIPSTRAGNDKVRVHTDKGGRVPSSRTVSNLILHRRLIDHQCFELMRAWRWRVLSRVQRDVE